MSKLEKVRKNLRTTKGKRKLTEAGGAALSALAGVAVSSAFKRGSKHWNEKEGYDAFASSTIMGVRTAVGIVTVILAQRKFPRKGSKSS